MRRQKQRIIFLLLFALLTALLPMERMQMKAKSPAKIEDKDFTYTTDGKKTNFFKISQSNESYYYIFWDILDTKNRKDSIKNFKTNRSVTIGSTETFLKKKYGNTKKIKVSKKETYYKCIKYSKPDIDFSAWKSYMDYSYKKGSDKYRIRFYLNQKNKVTAVVFLKNFEKFYNWPNEELKPCLDFQAPEGKKVTTKTINGKKVYMLPKGTKLIFKKGVMSEQEFKQINESIAMYNADGIIIAGSVYEYNAIELGEGIDLESMINTSVVHTDWEGGSPSDTPYINTEKLGEYLYFTITCDNFVYNNDGQGGGSRSKAPAIYYFKFQ